jgi:hypothetical protein
MNQILNHFFLFKINKFSKSSLIFKLNLKEPILKNKETHQINIQDNN